jgi:hypothetical protein
MLIKEYFTPRSLIKLCNYFQISKLSYGMCVYINDKETMIKLEQLKNKFFKSVLGMKNNRSSNKTCLAMGFPRIESQLFTRLTKVVMNYNRNFGNTPSIMSSIMVKFREDIGEERGDTLEIIREKARKESLMGIAKLENLVIGPKYDSIRKNILFTWNDRRDRLLVNYFTNHGFFQERWKENCVNCRIPNSRTHVTNVCPEYKKIRDLLLKELSKLNISISNVEEFLIDNFMGKVEFPDEKEEMDNEKDGKKKIIKKTSLEDAKLKKVWYAMKIFISSLYFQVRKTAETS